MNDAYNKYLGAFWGGNTWRKKILNVINSSHLFNCFMEGETWGDLWLIQDFAHASIVNDQN